MFDCSNMETNLTDFRDIVEARRINNDAFTFMSRHWSPQPANKLDKYLAPQQIKHDVAMSLAIDKALNMECEATGKSKEELRKEMLSILEEIGLDRKVYVIRWLGVFLVKSLLRTKTSVLVNERNIFKLKAIMGKNPVVFLPTHRSYADFMLMTYICYHYEIEFPAVAAGMDFHSMAVLGRAMRDTCAFYMRRTLMGDPLYAATFRRYVRTLTEKYHAPIEFFLEGTRSRSNKTLTPKYGLLSMVLASLFSHQVSDITVVPVSISYDRLMEQKLFTYEHLGVPKPKESTSALFKALNILNEPFGNIYVNVGNPMSVKEYFGSDLKPTHRETLKPVEYQDITPEEYILVQSLGEEVVRQHQKYTIINTFNILSAVLMKNAVKNIPLKDIEVYDGILWLEDILKKIGANVSDHDKNTVKSETRRILSVHRSIVKFDADRNLRLIGSLPIILSNDIKNKMKGHVLKEETMYSSVPALTLQLYVNPLLHLLMPHAIIWAVVKQKKIKKDELHRIYDRLRHLSKCEIVYNDRYEDEVFENAFTFLTTNGVMYVESCICPGNNTKLQEFLTLLVWPTLCCLKQCAVVLNELKSDEENLCVKKIQERVEFDLLQGKAHPYCLSLECIRNCLQGLLCQGNLIREKKDKKIVYSVKSVNMSETIRLINSVTPQISAKFDTSNKVVLDQRSILSRL